MAIERIYKVSEIAEMLQVSERSVFRYIREYEGQKKLKAFKLGGQWRVKEEDLKAFMNDTSRSNIEKEQQNK